MLAMKFVFRISLFCFLVFFDSSALQAKNSKPNKADDRDYTVVNTLVNAVDVLGDACSSNAQVLADSVEAKKVIGLSLWLWSLPGVDKSEMAINLECFSKANAEVYRKEFETLNSALQEEIKNALKKQKEKGESNS